MKFRDGISIIVTVYNKEQFISKTLETISKQMSGNSQLIIINDGSTDKSESVSYTHLTLPTILLV